MKSTLMRITLISFLLVLLIPNLTSAELKTFIRGYTYQASEYDSRNTIRTLAFREVKRLLLEELGTYLENIPEVQDFKLTKDQITTLTAGIIKTELVEEKWDGRTYLMKSKIAADSDKVIKSIDVLRQDLAKTKELEEVRKKSEDLLKENERLRKELAAKGKKRKELRTAYDQTIKELRAVEWIEKAYADYHAGNKNGAIAEFSKAIELNPKYAEAYNGRGTVYNQLGKYDQAIDDFDKAMEINPKYAEAYNNRRCSYSALEINPELAPCYYNRGIAYGKRGNYNQAIKDYSRAIELDPKFAAAYTNRGIAYYNLRNYNQAIMDYSRAIEINQKNAIPYYNRGIVYGELGNYNQSIKDFNRAIMLNPKDELAYYNRGLDYVKLGNTNQAYKDIKMAASIGHKPAQDFLRQQGIDW